MPGKEAGDGRKYRKKGFFEATHGNISARASSGDAVENMIREGLKSVRKSRAGSDHKKSTSSSLSSGDVVAAMAKRLRHLEKTQKSMRDQIVASEKKVLTLEQLNATLVSDLELAQSREGSPSDLSALLSENERLRRQVFEMERFLADYGMVWVGGTRQSGKNDVEESAQCEEKKDDAGTPEAAKVNVRVFLRKLRELNALAGEEELDVAPKGGSNVHVFSRKSKVSLVVYEDGIFLKRGPFRPYTHPAGARFVRDVLDGYFPSEFEAEYPDGVVFDIADRSCETYSGVPFKAFSGKGNHFQTCGR